MLYKRKGFRIITAVILCALGLVLFNPLRVQLNNYKLKKAFTSVDAETVRLNTVVPFRWDYIYAFDSYLSKAEMAGIIGFESGALRETASEGMVQLVFVRGHRVVGSVCGYSSMLGYSLYFSTGENNFSRLTFADDAVFSVEKREGIVLLRYIADDTQLTSL